MKTTCKRCVTDEEFAAVSHFFIKNRRDLHPAYTTMDMVALLYSFITEGNLVCIANDDGRVLGASAYHIGTQERNFEDQEVAFVSMAIMDRAGRGTRLFVKGLIFLVNLIEEHHPEVEEIRFAGLQDNQYICNLYAKFMNKSHSREGVIGEEVVFSEKISKLKADLKRFQRV